jgi:D-methionine transport system substrate-binding protein
MRFKLVGSALLVSVFLLLNVPAFAKTLTIGASEVPHAEILEVVIPQLAKAGIKLNIKVFNDYVQPNLQLADKQLDANYFQHRQYLDTFNKDRKTNLVVVGLVHIEPFGGYSKKITKLEELKTGATVAIPNDPSNGGRALALLHQQGLIKLDNPSNVLASPANIIENPKNLQFRELDAAMLPRALDDVELALINTNYALAAGLHPTKDALFIESADSPYVNVVVTRADNANAPAIKKLVDALHSAKVRTFILEKYQGAVSPAF